MKRREFIAGISSAAAWPVVARAQERARRVAVMMKHSAEDSESKARATAFLQGVQQRGWVVGQNVQIDFRWNAGTVDDARKIAAELVALSPHVILASGLTSLVALRGNRNVPQVFAIVPDPVGAGFVERLGTAGW